MQPRVSSEEKSIHDQLTGRYHFKDYDSKINFENLIVLLEKNYEKLLRLASFVGFFGDLVKVMH